MDLELPTLTSNKRGTRPGYTSFEGWECSLSFRPQLHPSASVIVCPSRCTRHTDLLSNFKHPLHPLSAALSLPVNTARAPNLQRPVNVMCTFLIYPYPGDPHFARDSRPILITKNHGQIEFRLGKYI